MRVQPRVAVAALAALALAGASSGCGGVPGGAVAVVDGKEVTRQAFDHWLRVAAASQNQAQPGQKAKPVKVPKPGDANFKVLRDQVMQFLINGAWIQAEAKDRGVELTEREISKQFEQTKNQSFPTAKKYKEFLARSGMTQEDVNFRVSLDLLSQKIRQKVSGRQAPSVSADDAKTYYEINKERYTQPERRDLRVVVNKDRKKVEEAQAQLGKDSSAGNWKAVAKKFSTDQASKDNGGLMPGVAKGQQEAALDEAVFAASKKEIGGPVKTQFGYYAFQVQKITPSKVQSFKSSKEGIQQIVAAQRQQDSLDSFVQDFRARWRKRTDCADAFTTNDCDNAKPTVQRAQGQPPVGGNKPIAPGQTNQRQGLAQGPRPPAQPTPAGLPGGLQLPGGAGGAPPGAVPPAGGAPPPGQ